MNKKTFVIIIVIAALASAAGVLAYNKLSPSVNQEASTAIENVEPERIGWEAAKQLIADCNVASASQTHALEVGLTDNSEKSYVTTEPAIDDIFKEVDKYKEKCDTPLLVTE